MFQEHLRAPVTGQPFHQTIGMKENEQDTLKTIQGHSQGLYKDKGSRFIALAWPVKDEEKIKELLAGIKKEYHDARHHCFAWVLGQDKALYRTNDDGEPSGTAGQPIYGQILSHDLCNILIVVVRYFGGTKLGVRGLINAYRQAARQAIANNRIITKTLRKYYRLHFDYPAMNDIMRVMKTFDLQQEGQDFGLRCSLDFSVRKSLSHKVIERFRGIPDIQIRLLHTD